ncbi:hypothetical protein [Actinomadura macrotermitis]|uniref:Uncharacterized protein n=1 Tax=Actinomadura macrotermitis TaxID=2585200 RepID=A0A7K0C576_9ACTN|nr:hypothetical protein [Actinomadura macrotermitis]MQY08597.1 hypothetical protein [Actinomadura macrotermitis]
MKTTGARAAVAAALAVAALAGCRVQAGTIDRTSAPEAAGDRTPAAAGTTRGESPDDRPTAGATAPGSDLPRLAGDFSRDYPAEERQAATLRELQNDPPPAGPKYSLGPLMAGIYMDLREPRKLDEVLVLRAEGSFPDTGAALTDFTARIRAQGAELTPVDPGKGGGSAGCTPRTTTSGGTKIVCYLVDETTLLLVSSSGTVQDVGEALAHMHGYLRA